MPPDKQTANYARTVITGFCRGKTSPISAASIPASHNFATRFLASLSATEISKPSRGLRIVEQGQQVLRNLGIHFDTAFGELPVGFQTSGNIALANTFQRARQHRYVPAWIRRLTSGAVGDLARMADQAEAGHVSHAMHCKAAGDHDLGCSLVEVVMEWIAARIQPKSAAPRLIAVEITPVPIGLVKMQPSPPARRYWPAPSADELCRLPNTLA